MATFFQAGVLTAFLQGIYEGDVSFGELAQKGNLGLGTVNGVDGEMVALDGIFYRMDPTGKAAPLPKETCTNFAVVSSFEPVKPILIKNIPSMTEMNQTLDKHIDNPNLFYMIRIEAELAWIKLRSLCRPEHPYLPLVETLPKVQRIFELSPSTGTLVVSLCPEYSGTITIPGYHYHYINEARTIGGHVYDFQLKKANVMINALSNFEMKLFNTPEFAKANLVVDLPTPLKKLE